MTNHAINGKPMAYGIIGGHIPFAGKFLDGESAADISGDLQWKATLPDTKPNEGKLDVAMALFVDGAEVRKRPRGCLRLGCEMVSQLNAGDRDAQVAVLGMLLESSGNAERFNIHCTV